MATNVKMLLFIHICIYTIVNKRFSFIVILLFCIRIITLISQGVKAEFPLKPLSVLIFTDNVEVRRFNTRFAE